MERINYELLAKLDKEFGSPFYTMDGDKYRKNITGFLDSFRCRYDRVIAGYSFKTNYVPALCQIAKNTYLSYLKKHKEPEKEETLTSSLEEMMLDKESAFLIHQALHNLPEPYKEVFSLRVLGELSFQQIGLLFGKTENWARVTYHRARLRIKEELK